MKLSNSVQLVAIAVAVASHTCCAASLTTTSTPTPSISSSPHNSDAAKPTLNNLMQNSSDATRTSRPPPMLPLVNGNESVKPSESGNQVANTLTLDSANPQVTSSTPVPDSVTPNWTLAPNSAPSDSIQKKAVVYKTTTAPSDPKDPTVSSNDTVKPDEKERAAPPESGSHDDSKITQVGKVNQTEDDDEDQKADKKTEESANQTQIKSGNQSESQNQNGSENQIQTKNKTENDDEDEDDDDVEDVAEEQEIEDAINHLMEKIPSVVNMYNENNRSQKAVSASRLLSRSIPKNSEVKSDQSGIMILQVVSEKSKSGTVENPLSTPSSTTADQAVYIKDLQGELPPTLQPSNKNPIQPLSVLNDAVPDTKSEAKVYKIMQSGSPDVSNQAFPNSSVGPNILVLSS